MLLLVIALNTFVAIRACPNVKPMETFDLISFARGRWYEVARYSHEVEENADCVAIDYVGGGVDGEYVITATMREVVGDTAATVTGRLYPHPEAGKVIYSTYGEARFNITSTIVNSDNRNYVIFYNCIPSDGTNPQAEVLWIVSRTRDLGPDIKSAIHKYIEETHFLEEKRFIWDHFTSEHCLALEENV